MRFSSLTLAAMAAAAVIALPAAAQDAPANVTFTRDIAPIFQRSCQSCHRTGSIAPMSLLTYEEVRPWARSIKQRIESREMPPWFIDRHVGVQGFKADKSLSNAELAIVYAGPVAPEAMAAHEALLDDVPGAGLLAGRLAGWRAQQENLEIWKIRKREGFLFFQNFQISGLAGLVAAGWLASRRAWQKN